MAKIEILNTYYEWPVPVHLCQLNSTSTIIFVLFEFGCYFGNVFIHPEAMEMQVNDLVLQTWFMIMFPPTRHAIFILTMLKIQTSFLSHKRVIKCFFIFNLKEVVLSEIKI